MDSLSHNISINLKRIRKAKGMSLDIVAEQTGVSKSMLAQIEKGEANPSIGVLGKIVAGLRLEFHELIDPPPRTSCLVSLQDMVPVKELVGQYKVWNCFPFERNRVVEIYRIEIEPNGIYVSGGHGPKTREYISVISGELCIEMEDGIHMIKKDEVFRFESEQMHKYRNVGDIPVYFTSFFIAYGLTF